MAPTQVVRLPLTDSLLSSVYGASIPIDCAITTTVMDIEMERAAKKLKQDTDMDVASASTGKQSSLPDGTKATIVSTTLVRHIARGLCKLIHDSLRRLRNLPAPKRDGSPLSSHGQGSSSLSISRSQIGVFYLVCSLQTPGYSN